MKPALIKRPIWANLIMFQLGWFACVLGAAYDRPWQGTIIGAFVLFCHLRGSPKRLPEFQLILVAATLGFVFDTVLLNLGWLVYASQVPLEGIAPIWIVMLWICFATTLNLSLDWMKEKLLLAVLFGLLGGPIAYLSGAGIGALQFVDRPSALVYLSLGWACITPLLVYCAGKLDGWKQVSDDGQLDRQEVKHV